MDGDAESAADLEVERLLASLTREDTPLGPLASWPQTLRNAVQLILPAQAQIVLFWGPEYVALYNDAYAPTIGDKHPGALGRPASENWAELWDDLEPLLRSVRDTGRTVYAKDREFYIERRGGAGETVYFDISYSAIPDDDGAVGGVLCIVSETTVRFLAERRAQQDRDRLWALSQDPFLVADHHGVWLSASPAWTRILGWTEAELIGRTSEWMEHPDDRAKTRDEVSQLAAGETTIRFENRFRTRDGDYRTFAWTAAPDGDLMYCVARDVTAEREAEADRSELEQQLRQSQKMEAVGQLTGGVAHDFNNLLTVIIGGLETIERHRAGDPARVTRALDLALQGARRAASLTERLLAFSRRQPLDPKPVDLNLLVGELSGLLQRVLGETVGMATVLADGLWTAEIDQNQLESALLNLTVNARDAMPAGGRLTIETANVSLDEAYAAHAEELSPGDYVVIAVSDDGVGMDQQTLTRVFEPFFTTKEVGRGTGLGLSMVYGFVKQSGGHVTIYSEPERGTTVRLYLPRSGSEPCRRREGGEADIPQARGEVVLVVEDHDDVRAHSCQTLRDLGYEVLEASDGAEAVAQLKSGARVDLLFTDVVLPGKSGRAVADAALALRPSLKVLFTTGYARNAITRHGRLDPGLHLLGKPFTVAQLANRVREALGDTAA